ncbi:MAG: DUF2283 domain-containing protein [Acidobacteriota bacterium]
MKIKYFEDTDTALLELGVRSVSETRELSEDVYLDLDEQGNVVSITIEHASRRSDLSEITFQRLGKPTTASLDSTH